ncbi:phage tail protein [Kitasatospora atroaurantiaca]|uniref:Phage tail-like protein n=1 Tax=Kitasatospora atroaurantiaca TaxID=285545 RepID=A0A561EZS6_9ACTN|nr:phage tail protein [Kitasatospora atroaurantiaca]TWE21107.1 phage tail-like protein [Kitasatospora atroaurantiaca]
MADDDPAVSVCFIVKIDDFSLGAFNSCEGLGCEVVMEQREEGGNNGYVWQLPSRIKYSNIKLTRPVTKDTEKVTRWIAGMVSGVTRKTGQISAMTADGRVVARWSLMDVVPVRWQGPSLSPENAKVATETLEIAHHGFLDSGRG